MFTPGETDCSFLAQTMPRFESVFQGTQKVLQKGFFSPLLHHLVNKITLFGLRLRRDLWQLKCCLSAFSMGKTPVRHQCPRGRGVGVGGEKPGRAEREMGPLCGFNKALAYLWGALENCHWSVSCFRGRLGSSPNLVQSEVLPFGRQVLCN